MAGVLFIWWDRDLSPLTSIETIDLTFTLEVLQPLIYPLLLMYNKVGREERKYNVKKETRTKSRYSSKKLLE